MDPWRTGAATTLARALQRDSVSRQYKIHIPRTLALYPGTVLSYEVDNGTVVITLLPYFTLKHEVKFYS